MSRYLFLLCVLGACDTTAVVGDASLDGGTDASPGTDALTPAGSAAVIIQAIAADRVEVSAYFYGAHATPGCTETLASVNCHFTHCNAGSSLSGTKVSAGTVEVTDFATLSPTADDSYSPVAVDHAWQPGATLAVFAAGGDVPTFSSSVAAPPAVVVTQPSGAQPFGTTEVATPLSRAADFAVAWTPAPTHVTLQLTQTTQSAGSNTIECAFDGTAGTAVIPKAVLAGLTPTSSPTTSTTLTVQSLSTTMKSVGGYFLVIDAINAGATFDFAGGVSQ